MTATATVPLPCVRFQSNLSALKSPLLLALSQCKSTFITADVIEGAFALLSFIDSQVQLDQFIDRTHCFWELIAKSSDVEPILDAALGGFKELGEECTVEIKRIAKNKEVDSDVQGKILNIGRSLVKIAIRELQATGSTTAVSAADLTKMAKLYNLV